jgi:hypothetical protein
MDNGSYLPGCTWTSGCRREMESSCPRLPRLRFTISPCTTSMLSMLGGVGRMSSTSIFRNEATCAANPSPKARMARCRPGSRR